MSARHPRSQLHPGFEWDSARDEVDLPHDIEPPDDGEDRDP
jgi:hypothetical protein